MMNKRIIVKLLFGALLSLVLVIVLSTSSDVISGLQGVSVVMTPTSGPPGTTVSLQRTDSGPMSACTANGDPTGFTYTPIPGVPGGTVVMYVVPVGTPAGPIDFDCVLFTAPQYVGTFRVTPPPPSPTPPPQAPPAPNPPPIVPASMSPLNGPPGTIVTVSNPDPNRTLSCTVLGPNSESLGTVDTSPAGASNYTIPTTIGDNLQLIFVCTHSSIQGDSPNSQAFTFTIDNVCTPRTDWQFEYTVQRGETLFEIAQRLEIDHNILCEANCDRVPVCSQIHNGNVLRVPRLPSPIISSDSSLEVSILPSELDLFGILTGCPELIPAQENLPAVHTLLGIAASNNPCEALLDHIYRVPLYTPLSDAASRHMLQNCPSAGAVLIGFLSSLAEWDTPLAQRIDGQITVQNVCDVAQAIVDKRRLPVSIAKLTPTTTSNYARLQGSDDADLKYIITACVPSLDSDRRDVILSRIVDFQITADDLYSDPAKCGFIVQLMTIDPRGVTPLEGQLIQVLLDCNPTATYTQRQQSYQFYGQAVMSGADISGLLSAPNLCQSPFEVLVGNLPSFEVGSIQPDIPAELRACPDIARALRHFRHANGPGTSSYELWLILNAPDPCSAAAAFLRGGALPRPLLLDTNCIIRHDNFVQATLFLRDETTVFQIADTDTWQQRMRYVSRVPSRLCDPLDDLEAVDEAPQTENTLCVQASVALLNETATPLTARMRIVSTDTSGESPVHYAETGIISQQFIPNSELPSFTVTALVNDHSSQPNMRLNVVHDFGNLTDLRPESERGDLVRVVDRSNCIRTTPALLPPPPPPLPQGGLSQAAPSVAPPNTPQAVEEPDIFDPLPPDDPTIMASFVGTNPDGTSDIYIGQSGTIRQFTSGSPTHYQFPAINEVGTQVAYLEIDDTNTVKLHVQPLHNPSSGLPYVFEGFSIEASRLAWTPDDHLLITLRALENDQLGIYEIDPRSESSLLQPRLKIANGASPTISHDGSVIAFVRESDGYAQIWTTTLIGFGAQKLSDHPAEVSCFDPAFGADALYFMCEIDGVASLFRYDAGNVLALFQTLTVETIAHPAPGPAAGYVAYDNGVNIYLRRDLEGNSFEELMATDTTGNISFTHLQWQATFQPR